jgi:hypothetical protein
MWANTGTSARKRKSFSISFRPYTRQIELGEPGTGTGAGSRTLRAARQDEGPPVDYPT